MMRSRLEMADRIQNKNPAESHVSSILEYGTVHVPQHNWRQGRV